MAKLCHEHGSTAHYQKMIPVRSVLLRPSRSAVSAFGIPHRHGCTGASPEQGCQDGWGLEHLAWRSWVYLLFRIKLGERELQVPV